MAVSKTLLVVIIVVISLVIFSFFVVPKYQESVALEAGLMQRRAQYDGRIDYYLKLSQVLGDIEQREDVLQKINDALPAGFSVYSTIDFFQEQAKESGMTV